MSAALKDLGKLCTKNIAEVYHKARVYNDAKIYNDNAGFFKDTESAREKGVRDIPRPIYVKVIFFI